MELKTAQKQATPVTATPARSKLAQVLNESVLREVLNEGAPVEEIVENLFRKGHQLFKAVRSRALCQLGGIQESPTRGKYRTG